MKIFEPADIIIYIQGKGIVLKEKSLIACNSATGKIIALGNDAVPFVTDCSNAVQIISPLHQGRIADFAAASHFFQQLLYKAWGKKPLYKPPIAISIPVYMNKTLTEVDKKALTEAIYQAGAREVTLLDVPTKQLLDMLPTLYNTKEMQKFKTVIGIMADDPERYIKEQLSELLEYAKLEGISAERVRELLEYTIYPG